MVRLLGLLIAGGLLVATTVVAEPAIADGSPGCSFLQYQAGTCGVSDGGGVVVTGTETQHHPGGGSSGSAGGQALTAAQIQALLDELCTGIGDCGFRRGGDVLNPLLLPGAPGAPGTGTPPVTVTASDVARFLPALGALHSEPDGWAVVGVPANFWADVSAI